MRKKIGIVASKKIVYDGTTRSNMTYLGISEAYITYFKKYGNVIIIDATSDNVENVDLLVLPGGADVLPTRYTNDAPNWYQQSPDLQMEWFDMNMLPQYIQNNTPIFGICRGAQSLNVHFGGTLVQDYPYVRSVKSRDELVEDMAINNEFFGLKTKKQQVNSLHHQGFHEEHLGKDIIPVGISEKHKNVEAFIHTTFPIAAVQYHPEEIHDLIASILISRLLHDKSRTQW